MGNKIYKDITKIEKQTEEIEKVEPGVFTLLLQKVAAYRKKGIEVILQLLEEQQVYTYSNKPVNKWVYIAQIEEDECNYKSISENKGPGTYKIKAERVREDAIPETIYITKPFMIGSNDPDRHKKTSTQAPQIDLIGVMRELKDISNKNAENQNKYMENLVTVMKERGDDKTTTESIRQLGKIVETQINQSGKKNDGAIIEAIKQLQYIIPAIAKKEDKNDITAMVNLINEQNKQSNMMMMKMMEAMASSTSKKATDWTNILSQVFPTVMQGVDYVANKMRGGTNDRVIAAINAAQDFLSEAVAPVVSAALQKKVTSQAATNQPAIPASNIAAVSSTTNQPEVPGGDGKDQFFAYFDKVLEEFNRKRAWQHEPAQVAKEIMIENPAFANLIVGYKEEVEPRIPMARRNWWNEFLGILSTGDLPQEPEIKKENVGEVINATSDK